jgi:hypothetical protein
MKKVILGLILLVFASCSFNELDMRVVAVKQKISKQQASSIAHNFALIVEKHFPIRRTTLFFPMKEKLTSLDMLLEDELRMLGYTIADIKKKKSHTVDTKMTWIDSGILSSSVSVGKKVFSRVYLIDVNSFEAVTGSPFTIGQLENAR